MSGAQIGTVVGGIVGWFFGVPQLGAMIGGAIGGYIDPTKVQGPRLSDGMTVTANDGIPNPWGFGTFINSANVLNSFELVEHEHTDDGKGSGVEQTTYTYTRSYALGICRANRNEDGTYTDIAGVLRATHNGKVVYNVQPDATSQQLANNAKFLENHKFYLGGETQLPDPTLESYLGTNNASAYRGQVYMVATDEDQTDSRGSLGTWEFVVAMEGSVEPHVDEYYAGRVAAFADSHFPVLGDSSDYTFTGTIGIRVAGGSSHTYVGTSIEDVIDHFTNYTYPTGSRAPVNYLGYSYDYSADIVPGVGLDINDTGVDVIAAQESVINNEDLVLVYNDYIPTILNPSIGFTGFCGIATDDVVMDFRGAVGKLQADDGGQAGLFENCAGDVDLRGFYPLCIVVKRIRVAPESVDADWVAVPDAPGYYLDPEGNLQQDRNFGAPTVGTFKILRESEISVVEGRLQFTQYEVGPAIISGDPRYNNQAFWEEAYTEAVESGEMPAGLVYGDDYPVIVTSAWLSNIQPSNLLTIDGVPLGEIVAEVCRRCGLSSVDIDVSELIDIVHGFKVATEATGESILSALMTAYFFDVGEWDDLLQFIKRGGDPVFALTPEDMAQREGPVIEETQVQEVEILRKVHVRSMDPAAGYVETTQTWERRAKTVAADGEQTIQVPVVMDKDVQAQIAEKRGKVAWSEDRRFAFTLPYNRPELTPTDVGTVTDRKGRTQVIRLMEMTDDSARIEVTEGMLNRQSAYTSDVQGVTHGPPTDTSPGLIGPTFGVPMNLPSLRTQDNTPGAYIAACGLMSGWRACTVLLSVDGGESFATVMTISQPSRMGILTADVSASPADPIEVFMRSGQINSITDAQLAARGNAWAITSDFSTASAVSEIGQSKTATLQTGGGYELTDNVRGGLGTIAAAHEDGDPFVMLSSVYFLPLDISLAGQTLYFKFVSIGTSADNAEEIPFVFNPLFTSITVDPITVGGENITVSGQPIYVVTSNA